MARQSKLTPEQWAVARRRWEGTDQQGFAWLCEELKAAYGVELSRPGVRQTAVAHGWEKGGSPSEPLPAAPAPAAKDWPSQDGGAKLSAPNVSPPGVRRSPSIPAHLSEPEAGPEQAPNPKIEVRIATLPAGRAVNNEGTPELRAEAERQVADEVVDGPEVHVRRGRGRPTKYRPEFAEQIVDYFDQEPEIEVKVEQPNGLVKLQRLPRKPPMLALFAKGIGVDLTTLNRWATEIDGGTGKPMFPDFADAYAHARELQEALIAQGSLVGLYDSKACQFLLKNLHGWQDQPARKVAVAAISKDELEARYGVRMAAARDRMLAVLAERRELLVNDPGDDG